MSDKLLDVLKAAVISKACRGRYINVRRTLRDLENIQDAELDSQAANESSMDKLVTILGSSAKTTETLTKDLKTLGDRFQQFVDSTKK
tara:strand:- start:143 stop:406 length:264 start_codon:yes stop_codon:yes gene_type:complete